MKESVYINKNMGLVLTRSLCIIPNHKDISDYQISINKKYIIASGKLEINYNKRRRLIDFSYVISKNGIILEIRLKERQIEKIVGKADCYASMCDTSKWLYEIFKSANNKEEK